METMLLLGYCSIIMAVSLLGGKMSEFITLTHTRTQMLMSFISGFIIGIAINHLLPHGLALLADDNALEQATYWMLVGIVLMVLLLRTFNFHQHEIGGDKKHDKQGESVSNVNLLSIAMGLGFHALMEGIALGTSIQAGLNGAQAWPGLGVFLAIILHKPLDAYSIIGMMRSAGYSGGIRTLASILFSLLSPIMTILTFWGVTLLTAGDAGFVIGRALAFASGAFLCISLSDLLPEIQFHHHDRTKLTAFFLLGVLLSYALHYIEH